MARRRDEGLTRAIANEAARLLAEEHCHDSATACRKAAKRLGEHNAKHWPDAETIESALRDYQGLFQSTRQPAALKRLRQLALSAMKDLAEFKPQLVGAVANGVADQHSPIRLLLHAEVPEQVAMALEDKHIPWHSAEVVLLFSRNRRAARPSFHFQAGVTTMELVVLAPADQQNPPRDAAGRGPLRGLSIKQLQATLHDAL